MIKGLTDRTGALPRIGELRKGAAKGNGNAPGKDLPYFRFTTKEPDVAKAFLEHYGTEPAEIEITFPYETTDENFEAWQEAWVAGGLRHRCDGRVCVLLRDQAGKLQKSNAPCPGGCKPVGRLGVILPRLGRLATVSVLTTSVHDITAIHQSLMVVETMRGSLRGIPFLLRRRPKKISIPSDSGKPVRAEKWLIELEAAPHWVTHQLVAMEQAALPPASFQETEEGDEEIGLTIEGEVVEQASVQAAQPRNTNGAPAVDWFAEIRKARKKLYEAQHPQFATRADSDTHVRQTAVALGWASDASEIEGYTDLRPGEDEKYCGILWDTLSAMEESKEQTKDDPLI